jgi:hypothetical protein
MEHAGHVIDDKSAGHDAICQGLHGLITADVSRVTRRPNNQLNAYRFIARTVLIEARFAFGSNANQPAATERAPVRPVLTEQRAAGADPTRVAEPMAGYHTLGWMLTGPVDRPNRVM